VLCSNFNYSQQNNGNDCNFRSFEAYIDDKDTFSNIRNQPNGEIILKLNNKYGYGYILNIVDYKNGWFKINNISGIDAFEMTDFEGWIHNSIVGAATTHNLDVFDKPNGTNKIAQLIGEQDSFIIKEAYCNWIKIDSNGIIGWVKSQEICGNPVTTCP